MAMGLLGCIYAIKSVILAPTNFETMDTVLGNKLEAFYGLPNEVKFCKKCVISNQRPSSSVEFKSSSKHKKEVIDFDENGMAFCTYTNTSGQWTQGYLKMNTLSFK